MKTEEIKYQIADLSADQEKITSYVVEHVNRRMNRANYEWQYQKIGPDVIFTYALGKDKAVISTSSFLPYKLFFDDKERFTAKSENCHLLSDYRGSDIFKKLYDIGLKACLEKRIDVIWGLTPAYKVWEKKLEFFVYRDIIYDFMGVVSAPPIEENSGFKDRSIKTFYYGMFSLISKLKFFFNKKAKTGGLGLEASDRLKAAQDINRLFSAMSPGGVRLDMSEDFLSWRVYNNPNLKYVSKFFYDGDSLAGYFIYSLAKDSTAQIVDVAGIDDKTLQYAVYALLEELRKSNTAKFVYFGNIKNELNLRVFNTLKRFSAGKLVKNEGMNFVLKYLGGEEVTAPEKFYINALWTEGYSR